MVLITAHGKTAGIRRRSDRNPERSTDVLVIGGGPVGLALAGDLGWRGVNCTLLERGNGEITQPKMDLVGIRTMEFCRRWGIVADVEASPYPRDYPQDNVYLSSLNGFELGRERFRSMGEDRPPPVSPQKRERCPQNMFDPILRSFAGSLETVDIRYGQELLSFDQRDEEIVARVANSADGAEYELTARFIVGCDGARSIVAKQMGVTYDGVGVLTYTTNFIFRTDDFNALHDKEPGYRYIFIGPEGTWGTIVAINGQDRWRMSIVGSKTPRLYSEAELKEAAFRALGRPFDLEIISIVPWTRAELVANTYGNGRAFIAGDAAHVMSPTGGFGMNTGIGDAVDLSWKLAGVIEGWAGDSILDSYQLERRPVAVRNVREASGNLARMLSPGRNPTLLDPTPEGAAVRDRVGREFSAAMRREWYTLNIHLGYSYADSPLIVPEDESGIRNDLFSTADYLPTTQPGSRAPHVWLADGRSTLDLFGRGFVLMDMSSDGRGETLQGHANGLGIPLAVQRIEDAGLRSAYERTLVLVRPDGHVAWRGERLPADPVSLLRQVTGRLATQPKKNLQGRQH